MLLGDADVEHPRREAFGHQVDPGAVRHRRGNGADLVVIGGERGQGPAEDAGVGGRVGGGFVLFSGDHVEFRGGMATVGGLFGGGIALALPGDDMQQHRPGGTVAHLTQHAREILDIMPVERADIGKPQLLEDGAADGHGLQRFLGAARALLEGLRQQAHRALGGGFQLLKRLGLVEPGEIARKRPHRRRNRHVIVVQDHEQAFAGMTGVVHRLPRHARGHRTVANHRDGIAQRRIGGAAQLAGQRKAGGGGNRGRGMPGPERVIGAFAALGETRKPGFLPQGADTVAAAGEDLVGIDLMAHIPDDPVARGVEHMVQRHGQLDHAEPGTEMSAGLGNRRDRLGAKLVGELPEFPAGETFHVGGRLDAVEKRGLRAFGHMETRMRRVQVFRAITKRAASRKVSALLP